MMSYDHLQAVFMGALNIDIIANRLAHFAEPGAQVNGNDLFIGAGGKACNMAQMASAYLGADRVAMIGKTVKDTYKLWTIPIQALNKAGIITDFIVTIEPDKAQLPTIAIILGDRSYRNKVYYFRGVNENLSRAEIDQVQPLFEQLAQAKGFLVMSFEMPARSVEYALEKAAEMGIRVLIDPGGAQPAEDYTALLEKPNFLLKPNAHEAEQLSGVRVTDFQSASQAASILMKKGVQRVLITHGEQGAYLFGDGVSEHISLAPIPQNSIFESTGSGDQAMAILTAKLLEGEPLLNAAQTAVLAGTLQSYRAGTQALTRAEIDQAVEAYLH